MMLFGNINKGLLEYRASPDAILADVREADEYASGHIPGAVSLPLSALPGTALPRDKRIFLYCLRGARSKKAERILKRMGYQAKSIGGISHYKGPTER